MNLCQQHLLSSAVKTGWDTFLMNDWGSKNPLWLKKSISEKGWLDYLQKVVNNFRRVCYSIGMEYEIINHREK